MKIFLVRHAESELNAKNTHQYPHTKLSKTGLKQAESVAKRFSGIKIDVIMASRYRRAMQTAQIIRGSLKKKIIYTSLLNEIKYSTDIEGHKIGSRLSEKISEEALKHINDPNWHYSDEENFFDFKRRVGAFMRYLKKKNKENIIIVTHGHFIRMLLALTLFGDDMSMDEFYKFFRFIRLNNTGITECEFTEGRWRLLRLNDHAHLRD